MISVQLKPQKENTYCPLCFSIVTKKAIDKHLDEKPVLKIPELPKKLSRESKIFVSTKLPKQPTEKSINDFTLYVYDSLSPTRCISETYHSAENVTLETVTSNGIPVQFNTFYCSKCGKYYTNIEKDY